MSPFIGLDIEEWVLTNLSTSQSLLDLIVGFLLVSTALLTAIAIIWFVLFQGATFIIMFLNSRYHRKTLIDEKKENWLRDVRAFLKYTWVNPSDFIRNLESLFQELNKKWSFKLFLAFFISCLIFTLAYIMSFSEDHLNPYHEYQLIKHGHTTMGVGKRHNNDIRNFNYSFRTESGKLIKSESYSYNLDPTEIDLSAPFQIRIVYLGTNPLVNSPEGAVSESFEQYWKEFAFQCFVFSFISFFGFLQINKTVKGYMKFRTLVKSYQVKSFKEDDSATLRIQKERLALARAKVETFFNSLDE